MPYRDRWGRSGGKRLDGLATDASSGYDSTPLCGSTRHTGTLSPGAPDLSSRTGTSGKASRSEYKAKTNITVPTDNITVTYG